MQPRQIFIGMYNMHHKPISMRWNTGGYNKMQINIILRVDKKHASR